MVTSIPHNAVELPDYCHVLRYNKHMSQTYIFREIGIHEYSTLMDGMQKTQDSAVSFLQAPLYGRLQAADGKTVVYFAGFDASNGKAAICGLTVRYMAPGGLNFLYCPYGPTARNWTPELMRALQRFFKPVAARLNCAFVRLDANGITATGVKKPIPDLLARTASLQPRAEWVLDITPDEDTLWMAFHKHARYNVRLAERANAAIRLYKPKDAPLNDFYSLMQTTGSRDGFGIFNKTYYEAYLHTLANDEGFVVLCLINGKPAAAGLFVTYDHQAHYVFAGSSDDFRKIAPAYSVIWRAIQESKKRGCTLFNFGGVTDAVKGHDLSGVTSFKKRFGGYRVEHANPVDLVYKPLRYQAFKLYKTIKR